MECETSVTSDFIDVKNKLQNSDNNQVAYAFSLKSWKLILSEDGHSDIIQYKDRRDYCGGWVWKNSGDITYSCGMLSKVPEEFRDGVKDAIEDELKTFL